MKRSGKKKEAGRDDVTKEVIAAGEHLQLVCVDGWEYAERPSATGVVAIVAITDDGRLILTEQYRKPVDARVIDWAAGLVGDESDSREDAADAARRELEEETGYRAEEMVHLADVPSSAGLTSEVVSFFRATGLTKAGGGGGVASEDIEVHEIPREELPTWLDERRGDGALVDVKLFAGLYLADAAEAGSSTRRPARRRSRRR